MSPSLEGFLALGFLVGMQHALEADHLAAVGAMLGDGRASARRLAMRGAAWGLGHSITLFAICGAAITLGLRLGERVSAALEVAVGVMLVVIGAKVLYEFRSRRVHFHAHQHDDGRLHLHAHSHAGSAAVHADDPHRHQHPQGLPLKALAVGLVHGAAGSAGLLALAVAATREPLVAVAYVGLFGLGSMLGMACLSFAAAIPLGLFERRARHVHSAVCIAAGVLAIALGVGIVGDMGPVAFGL